MDLVAARVTALAKVYMTCWFLIAHNERIWTLLDIPDRFCSVPWAMEINTFSQMLGQIDMWTFNPLQVGGPDVLGRSWSCVMREPQIHEIGVLGTKWVQQDCDSGVRLGVGLDK